MQNNFIRPTGNSNGQDVFNKSSFDQGIITHITNQQNSITKETLPFTAIQAQNKHVLTQNNNLSILPVQMQFDRVIDNNDHNNIITMTYGNNDHVINNNHANAQIFLNNSRTFPSTRVSDEKLVSLLLDIDR